MIKNIILDIGDVLVASNYRAFFLDKGYDEETAERLEKATFFLLPGGELDRGVWNFEEITEAFVENAPELEAPLRSVFHDMNGFIRVYPYAEEWIYDLKERGFSVYILSNISDKICHDCAKDLQFLNCADGYVLSYQEQLIKPDAAIFRLLLERYGLSGDECIFIDDIRNNVDAAEKLGLHGIVFQDKNQAEMEIEKIQSCAAQN